MKRFVCMFKIRNLSNEEGCIEMKMTFTKTITEASVASAKQDRLGLKLRRSLIGVDLVKLLVDADEEPEQPERVLVVTLMDALLSNKQ